jgi:hypothetical protein
LASERLKDSVLITEGLVQTQTDLRTQPDNRVQASIMIKAVVVIDLSVQEAIGCVIEIELQPISLPEKGKLRSKGNSLIADPYGIHLGDVVVVKSRDTHAKQELVDRRSLSRIPKWGLLAAAIHSRWGWALRGWRNCLRPKTDGQQRHEADEENECTQLPSHGTTNVSTTLEVHVLAPVAILNYPLVVKGQ